MWPWRTAISLRNATTAALSAVAGLAVLGAVALVLVTTLIHRNASTMAAAIESVKVAEEIEIDLLTHARATDAIVRISIASELRARLESAREHVGSDSERALIARVETAVAAYLRAPPAQQSRRLEGAFELLEELVALNVAQARNAARTTAAWDRAANAIGISVASILLFGGGATIAWLRRAYRPAHSIAEAIVRFGQGDRSARAPEVGPTELRSVASQFNAMAGAIERQRENQLAFVAGVAHDLRNPLAALGLAVATADRASGAAPEPLGKSLGLVRRQIDRLDRMIDDLIDGVRIETGHLELRKVPCDLRQIVVEIADLYRPTTDRHDVRLVVGDRALMATCDPLRIEQALGNLVNNAIKYSPRGGLIELRLMTRDGEALISVRDEGVGMSDGDLQRVFEPFRRAGPGRDVAPGAGLGLSVARRIVEAHGGRIQVESQPGLGSTFTVRLPLEPHPEPVTREDEERRAVPSRTVEATS